MKLILAQIFCVGLIAILEGHALAQSYIDFMNSRGEVLVTQPTSNPGELNIYLSPPDWFGKSAGYTPIRVRVKPQRGAVFRNDGLLTVCIGTGGMRAEQCDRTLVSIPIVAGESEASAEVLANLRDLTPVCVSARFNGSFLRASSAFGYPNNASSRKSKIIFISEESSKIDRKRQDALARMTNSKTWYSSSEPFTRNSQSDTSVVFVNIERMPDNWLTLNGIDQAIISAEDLLRLTQERQRLLQDYSMAGGSLIVHRVSSADTIAKVLGLNLDRRFIESVDFRKRVVVNSSPRTIPSMELVEVQAGPEDFETDWDLVEGSYWDRFSQIALRNHFDPANVRGNVAWNPSLDIPDNVVDWLENRGSELGEIGLALIDFEWTPIQKTALELYPGISETPVFQVNDKDKRLESAVTILHGFGSVHLQPTSHRDLESANYKTATAGMQSINRAERFIGGIGDDFWEWLIPSVGRTPVIPFLLFVATFVGGVVPGIVFWCNRHKRRVWMVIAMPLMAALFTCLLFAYGIFKDGLGSVARIRSLTLLGTNRDGIVWSRQAYFAARIPENGILLSETTQVSSMSPYGLQSEPSEVQHTTFDNKQQYFNLLPPRTQKQFSIVHPVRDLRLFEVGDSERRQTEGIAVKNVAGFAWDYALFIDANENFYEAASVTNGSAPSWTKISKDEAANHLRRVHLTNPLQAPPDAPTGEQLSLNETLSQIFSFNRTKSFVQDAVSEEVFWKRSIGMITTQSGTNVDLEPFRLLPNTFIIYTSETPYLEKCLPEVKEEQGLHAIMGSWNSSSRHP